ncbi:hypothetical protein B0T24DRAFT_547369 [Lasiosphaeria ovina]|uniref:WHIM1 domain-containing protein n=1 Tax=Lasiosphaeria ovina TaxID=92902 RepID=A0AAE0NEJ2_9PEZI|nr:hypothetical protein B0T24DRAFT_547369 [Lasiosphaeria ovina]
MADDDSSDLSSISSLSAPPSEDESDIQLTHQHGILKFFHKVGKKPAQEPKDATPPRPRREPSPPHEYVLADNPDIAFIVMFRRRFTDAFPKSLPNFGPQELERDVVESLPGERVEHFLCALLGLLLNRKQDVKPGHYNRALEEAIQTHKGQWTKDWESLNPLSNSATFASMTPVQRLTLLRTLVHWALSSSDAIKTTINQHYKNRQDDDVHNPLSVQSYGSDGDKRRYFLIEGSDDTAFRMYRESNPAGINRTWWSVAGSMDDLKALSEKLEKVDGGPKARALARKITEEIPRFEATEEKRRRREYRQMRKEQFKRPEVGLSLYEGRTRGKRMKYTYSDDEADFYTDSTNRRSTRNTRHHTPAEPSGPLTTASGRQIRAPTRLNAENASSGAQSAAPSVQGDNYAEDSEMNQDEPVSRTSGRRGRPRRSAAVNHGMNGWAQTKTKKRKSDEYESDEEEESTSLDINDDEDEHIPDESDEEEEDFDAEAMDDDLDEAPGSSTLVFKFPVRVAFDEDSKVQRVPGPPVVVEKRKRPRTAHRNLIISDESESVGSTDAPDDDELDIVPQPEEPAAEVIAVAIKRVTPDSAEKTAGRPTAGTPVKSPLTPSSGPPTALAFRGSPEKPQHVPATVGVGYAE